MVPTPKLCQNVALVTVVMEFWRKHLESLRGLLLVTLLGLPFIWPLLRWTTVPCSHDGHLHYHRVAAMRHAWENGVYFSRWMPDLAFGYGFPFFVFREPLPLYVFAATAQAINSALSGGVVMAAASAISGYIYFQAGVLGFAAMMLPAGLGLIAAIILGRVSTFPGKGELD